ncbi:RidA family protein [Pelosinus sp. IPA-1]|uniref:RidA family protein n=1 Tax=Pelosinus sp. IPA-1 TaxID=3029569 RepID=UPI00243617BE|nr:RidA family protein [Pelosinus sp. IPA-1]GMB01790.1 RidA family protein [Pelosinus sp. IPA-1]
MKKIIVSDQAPKAIGPYSQAVYVDKLLFVSGQLPIEPANGTMPDDIKAQTKQSLKNIKAILETAGLSMDNVIKTTVYLKDLGEFAEVNDMYATFFKKNPPARVCVEISRLPKDALVEIDAIAYNGSKSAK